MEMSAEITLNDDANYIQTTKPHVRIGRAMLEKKLGNTKCEDAKAAG